MAEVTHLNFVKVGPQGTFAPSGRRPASVEHVDALLRHLEEKNISRVAVHFHGGLNNEGVGLNIAAHMRDLYAPDIHAVTFVWETGFLETLKKNLADLDKTATFWRVVELVARYAPKQSGVAGGRGTGQPLTSAQVQAELDKDEPFAEFDDAAAPAASSSARGGGGEEDLEVLRAELQAELEAEIQNDPVLMAATTQDAAQTRLLNPELRQTGADAQSRGIWDAVKLAKSVASVVIRVVQRRRGGRDHDFYPTIIEETLREISVVRQFGEWMWDGMKSAAEQMWLANDGLRSNERHVGTYFLDGLVALQQKRPELTVDVIGHSAGAIAICFLLRANAKRTNALQVRNVIFLAPACTSELFHEEVVKAPERFARFRMFTMGDDFESKDILVPGLYTRSLLYFISGVLEKEADTPIAGMERYLRGAAPYNTPELLPIAGFSLANGENRVVLSLSSKLNAGALEGLRCDAAHHGDFDDLDKLTGESLKWMLLESPENEEAVHADQ